MSVKKEASGRRSIQVEIEVPAPAVEAEVAAELRENRYDSGTLRFTGGTASWTGSLPTTHGVVEVTGGTITLPSASMPSTWRPAAQRWSRPPIVRELRRMA